MEGLLGGATGWGPGYLKQGIWPQIWPVGGGSVWRGQLTPSSNANWATRLWPHSCCWNNCVLSGQVFREGRGGAQVAWGPRGSLRKMGAPRPGRGPGLALAGSSEGLCLCDQESLLPSEPQVESAKIPRGLWRGWFDASTLKRPQFQAQPSPSLREIVRHRCPSLWGLEVGPEEGWSGVPGGTRSSA